MRFILIVATFAAFAAAGPVLADDSTAELATGRLAFVQTNDITMQSEDLYVSMDAIRRADRRVSLAVPVMALGGSLR
jgi:Domain of unknown function (DUF4424)